MIAAVLNVNGAKLPTSGFTAGPDFQGLDIRPLTGAPIDTTTTIVDVRGITTRGVALSAGTNNSITVSESYAMYMISATNTAGTVSYNLGAAGAFFTGGTAANAPFYVGGASSGGIINAAFWVNTNTATCGAGFVAGTAGDVCMYRAAANAWTFNSGTSLRVPQYLGVGSVSAPANTAAGAISTTKVTPALQAFGAVVANAASGVLAFTVSTAAVTCATAVVTNTNVVAGSEVILTMQSYTGTPFTNGFPSVARSDTSGSSVGSFTLQLCNSHATNALSGNLYVAFWVLN
jgi:hypothetical protein